MASRIGGSGRYPVTRAGSSHCAGRAKDGSREAPINVICVRVVDATLVTKEHWLVSLENAGFQLYLPIGKMTWDKKSLARRSVLNVDQIMFH